MGSWKRTTAAALGCLSLAACSGEGTPTTASNRSSTPTSSTASGHDGQGWPQPAGSPLPDNRSTALQKELGRWVATGLLGGATVAVVTPKGTWSGAAGADGSGTALQPRSGMALASITKTFTAAEVMLLAERGKVDLDAPASSYVDIPQVANGVTVRQLLAQRSGVTESRDGPLGDPAAHWTTARYLTYVPAATAKPGERFRYDNTNFILLGMVIEKATGRSVAAALKGDLWDPLALERFAYQDAQQLPPPLAHSGEDDNADGDLKKCAGAGPWLPCRALASLAGPAGGVAGDAETTARWGYALYGSRLLSRDSVTQMTDFSDRDGYGLGTWDYTAVGNGRWNIDAVGHTGSTIGYRTVLAVFEEARVSVAILTPTQIDPLPYVQYLVKAGSLLTP